MSVKVHAQKQPHRQKSKAQHNVLLAVLHGLVGRLLSSKEMHSNPKAWAAVEKEYNGLRDIGAWDESAVREWSFVPDSVKAEAARTKQEHHVNCPRRTAL